MRRDICYFYPLDVVRVYEGFLKAATSDPFRRDCSQEPYFRIGFGINFSMKYNMNGGSCTIHFMPYQNGTAVNLRFSIAQLAGARYEKYAEDLNKYAARNLGVGGNLISLDVDLFTNPANQVTAQSMPKQTLSPQAMPKQAAEFQFASRQTVEPSFIPNVQPVAPARVVPNEKENGFCSSCGSALLPDAAFCSKCGSKVVNKDRFCSRCGKLAPEDAAFCSACGNRL